MTKIFICGMCRNKGKEVKTTRKGLRNHLKTRVLKIQVFIVKTKRLLNMWLFNKIEVTGIVK